MDYRFYFLGAFLLLSLTRENPLGLPLTTPEPSLVFGDDDGPVEPISSNTTVDNVTLSGPPPPPAPPVLTLNTFLNATFLVNQIYGQVSSTFNITSSADLGNLSASSCAIPVRDIYGPILSVAPFQEGGETSGECFISVYTDSVCVAGNDEVVQVLCNNTDLATSSQLFTGSDLVYILSPIQTVSTEVSFDRAVFNVSLLELHSLYQTLNQSLVVIDNASLSDPAPVYLNLTRLNNSVSSAEYGILFEVEASVPLCEGNDQRKRFGVAICPDRRDVALADGNDPYTSLDGVWRLADHVWYGCVYNGSFDETNCTGHTVRSNCSNTIPGYSSGNDFVIYLPLVSYQWISVDATGMTFHNVSGLSMYQPYDKLTSLQYRSSPFPSFSALSFLLPYFLTDICGSFSDPLMLSFRGRAGSLQWQEIYYIMPSNLRYAMTSVFPNTVGQRPPLGPTRSRRGLFGGSSGVSGDQIQFDSDVIGFNSDQIGFDQMSIGAFTDTHTALTELIASGYDNYRNFRDQVQVNFLVASALGLENNEIAAIGNELAKLEQVQQTFNSEITNQVTALRSYSYMVGEILFFQISYLSWERRQGAYAQMRQTTLNLMITIGNFFQSLDESIWSRSFPTSVFGTMTPSDLLLIPRTGVRYLDKGLCQGVYCLPDGYLGGVQYSQVNSRGNFLTGSITVPFVKLGEETTVFKVSPLVGGTSGTSSFNLVRVICPTNTKLLWYTEDDNSILAKYLSPMLIKHDGVAGATFDLCSKSEDKSLAALLQRNSVNILTNSLLYVRSLIPMKPSECIVRNYNCAFGISYCPNWQGTKTTLYGTLNSSHVLNYSSTIQPSCKQGYRSLVTPGLFQSVSQILPSVSMNSVPSESRLVLPPLPSSSVYSPDLLKLHTADASLQSYTTAAIARTQSAIIAINKDMTSVNEDSLSHLNTAKAADDALATEIVKLQAQVLKLIADNAKLQSDLDAIKNDGSSSCSYADEIPVLGNLLCMLQSLAAFVVKLVVIAALIYVIYKLFGCLMSARAAERARRARETSVHASYPPPPSSGFSSDPWLVKPAEALPKNEEYVMPTKPDQKMSVVYRQPFKTSSGPENDFTDDDEDSHPEAPLYENSKEIDEHKF